MRGSHSSDLNNFSGNNQSGKADAGSEGGARRVQGVLGLGVGRAKDMAKSVVKAHEKARNLGL